MRKDSVSTSPNIDQNSTNETLIRVLCVDDEPNLLDTTKSILELQGSFQIETAASADEALQKIAEKDFDTIVSDYQMPIKSGLDFLKELRDAGNDIPFILFTGQGREEVAIKALNLGADRYFNKIGHPETVYGELAHGISQLAGKKSVEKQLKRLSAVIEQSSNTIVILDKEEKIVYANPTFLTFHDVSFDEVIGKHWERFIPEGHLLRNALPNIRKTVFEQKKMWMKEIGGSPSHGKTVWRRAKVFPLVDGNNKLTHVVYNGEDITEQKRNEQAIWDREERLRAIIASSPDAMIVTDLHGHLIDCNIQTLNLLGVSSRKEIMGKDSYKFVTKDKIANVKKEIQKLLEHGEINNVECNLTKKNGSRIDVEFSANTLRDAFGKPVGIVVLARDITERKKVEDAIKESEEKYRSIVELSPDGIGTMNMKGTITSINKAFSDMTGFSKEEIEGKHFTKLGTLRIQDIPKWIKLVNKFLKGKKHMRTEFDYKRKDGTESLGEAYISLLEKKGKKLGVQAILRDISEERKIQEALKDSEEKYRNIVELSPDGMISLDNKGIVTAVNRAILAQTGFAETDFVGKHYSQLEAVQAENLCALTKKINSFFKGEIPAAFELCYCCKDGTKRCAEATVGLINQNHKDVGIQLVFRDITERKKAAEKLRDSEEKFRSLSYSAQDSIILLDENGKIMYWNPTAEKTFGYTNEEAIGKELHSFIAPERFYGEYQRGFMKFKETGRGSAIGKTFELFVKRKDGTEFPIELSLSALKIKGKWCATGILRDISDRKKTEEALLESEKRFRELSEMLPVIVFELDATGKLTFVNREAYRTYGYSKDEFEKAINSLQAVVPEQQDRLKTNMAKLLSGEATNPQEFNVVRKDGTTLPIITHAAPIFRDNKVVGFRGISLDITERKKAEEKHLESEKRFKELAELLPEVIFEYDLNGKITYVNNEAYTRFGYSAEDFENGLNVIQFIAPEYVDKAKTNIVKIVNGKRSAILEEYKLIRKDGTTFPAIITAAPISKENKIVGIRGVIVDITERKKIEEKHLESEKKFRELAELLPEIIFEYDCNGKLTYVNQKAYSRFGFSKEEFEKGISIKEFIVPEELGRTKKNMAAILKGEKSINIAHNLVTKHGTKFPAILSGSPIIKDDKVVGARGILIDITELKKIEEDLKESEEKYHKQFEENLDAIVLADAETGIIIDCNRAATSLFGKTKSELIGKHQKTLHPPYKTQNNFSQTFIAHQTEKEGVALESEIVTKNGKIRNVIIKGNVIHLSKRKVSQGMFRDITEHKKAQDSILKERDTLEKVTGNLNTSLVMISKDMRILWTNKYLSNILGDVSGKLCYSALNRLDHICPGCKIKEVLKTGKQTVFETTVNNPEGEQNWPGGPELCLEITAIPIKDKNGNVTEVLELALNITERKKMENAIREAEEQHRVLMDSAKALITSVDNEGKYVYVNKEWKKVFGYSDEEIKEITIMDTVRNDHKQQCLKHVQQVSKGKAANDIETVFVTKDGTEINARGNARAIISNGKVISTVGVFLDITEHKKAEDKVKETLKKLETINEKLGVIGKLTRHDTRNKLSTIMNSTYLAKIQIDNKESALKHLESVDTTIDQIERILEFSRIYEMLGTQEKTNINVKSMIDEAFMLASQPEQIELVNDCQDLTVQADSLLRQVFYNLIENSAKHGETVTKIKVNYEETKNGLKLIYSDDGVGIPEKEKEQIFNEGYGKGTGYGLYLIRKICDEYGWTIKEKGKPGKGAKFVFSIPK